MTNAAAIEHAQALLAALGETSYPTVVDFLPTVEAATTPKALGVYKAGYKRLVAAYRDRTIDSVTTSERLSRLVTGYAAEVSGPVAAGRRCM